ncbi:MAG TPA: GntR family transcriptional regulator [Capillimicrobium sp.]|nr:GntR family transcriptional regulator [Capillimicrobium sp.]
MPPATSKQERTYAVLRQRIVDGVYGPGHRLVIDALARELEVSQMPVREAIRRLEAEGWVTYVRNQGAQVAPIDAGSWTEATATLAVLEGYATALAAPTLTADDIARMREINGEMLAAIEGLDVLAVSQHNLAFHHVIHERCPNSHLRRELKQIEERLDTLRRSIFLYIPMRGRVSIEEHEALLALIERGADPLEIELAAREHKLHTVAAYEERAAGR